VIAYTKPFLPLPKQIALLQSRGMAVTDLAKATHYLEQIGYYRLSGYWYPLRQSQVIPDGKGGVTTRILDNFRTGSELGQVVDLYVFDKRLRLLMLDVLERIEVALRTDVTLQMGRRDRWAHMSPSLLDGKFVSQVPPGKSTTRYQDFQTRFTNMLQDSKEDFVKHFSATYHTPLPIWAAVELWDFGMLSVFISGMQYSDVRAIAAKYNIPRPELLPTWVRTLGYVRNVCAHHSRLWNKPLTAQPKQPRRGEVPMLNHLVGDAYAAERFYSAAAIARNFQLAINPSSTWGKRFVDVVGQFPTAPGIAIGQAGFPAGWDSLPLWQ
jgi:abortive infection bacteriophage resistance protein